MSFMGMSSDRVEEALENIWIAIGEWSRETAGASAKLWTSHKVDDLIERLVEIVVEERSRAQEPAPAKVPTVKSVMAVEGAIKLLRRMSEAPLIEASLTDETLERWRRSLGNYADSIESTLVDIGVPGTPVEGHFQRFKRNERFEYTFHTDRHIPWRKVLISGLE